MKTSNVHRLFFLTLLLFCFTYGLAQVFVDASAGGSNNGTSWTNAYTDLAVALSNTSNGEIWVARGIYRPLSCNPCSEAEKETPLSIPPDVQLYGGFQGNETQLSQRDWTINLSILSGDIGLAGDSTDNSYKILVAENSTANTVLDGFIIEEGNADGSFGFSSGGGLYIDANPGGTGDIRVRNCTFRNNYGGGGGAIAIDCVLGGSSQALISDCIFEGNTASLRVTSTGGAIFMQGNSGAQIRPKIINCTFRNNFVGNDGAAISMTPTGAGTLLATLIDNCLFENNLATDRGGAIWYRMASEGTSQVVISKCRFLGNRAGGEGGAIYARSSFNNVASDTLVNCLFSQNNSDGSSSINDGEGGALFLRGSQNGTRNHEIINCVFDRNYAAQRGGAVATSSFVSSAGICNSNFINCTFFGNTTDGSAGSVHAEATDGGTNQMTIINSILWVDSTGTSLNEIVNNSASISVSTSNLQGGVPNGITDGGGNLDLDPGFADPENGDLRLTGCSALLDAGQNGAIPPGVTIDLDGDNRIHNSVVDLGAYEIGVVRVDQNATGGSNTGKSWTNAFLDLNDAIEAAESGDQIWVAQGTYFPLNCNPCSEADKETSFQIKPDVEMYGGFDGSETLLGQRDWTTNPTILSGDTGTLSDSTDNAYKVLVAENSTSKTVLDGFIIEEGNADGSFGFSSGGGLYIDANPGGTGDIQVRNCTFRNNYGGGGGAIAIDCVLGGVSNALIRDCLFEGNTASLRVSSTGAAIFMQGNLAAQVQPHIINCTFRNNFVNNDGGAISMTPTGEGTLLAPKIDSCLFENNVATDRGGAIWYRMSSQGNTRVVISNSRFIGNRAGGQGGAIYARSSFDNVANDTLINCLFSQNISNGSSTINDGEGGALFLRGSQNGTRNHEVINCVFDRNYASLRGGALATNSVISSEGTCMAFLTNCTFFNNKTDGTGTDIHVFGGHGSINETTIRNSIFWQDSSSSSRNDIVTSGTGIPVSVSYSLIRNGVPSWITDAGNNIDQDPQFLEASTGDLRISSCSPARNAGNNVALPPDLIDLDGDGDQAENIDLDLNGESRIFDTTVDMGAYEWNGTPQLMTITLDSTNVSCNGFCDASLSVNVSGGVAAYTYLWSNGASTASIDGLCPGNYEVTVSDAFSCVLMNTVVVIENPPLELVTTTNTTICKGESLTLNATPSGGTGDYRFQWNNGLSELASHLVTPEIDTDYSVTLTDGNGCNTTQQISVVVSQANPDISGQLSFCSGQSTTLDAGPFDTFLWSDGSTTRIIEVTAGNNYSVTVTDSKGCSGSDQVSVTENNNLTPTISGQLSFCSGQSTTLDAGPFDTFLWSDGSTTRTIEVTAGNNYSVTVTDSKGCSGSDQVSVTENNNLTPTISGQLSFCSGQSTTLDAGPFDTFLWSDGSTTRTIEVTAGNNYSVTVTDSKGCSGSDQVSVTENNNLTPTISGQLSFCSGQSTTLDAGPFDTFLWSDGSTTRIIEVTAGNNYSVTVTDSKGCSGSDQVSVVENEIAMPVIAGQLSICTGSSSTLSVGFYESYNWSNGQTTASIEVNSGGTYRVTVTDNDGCSATDEVTIIENTTLSPQISGELVICAGSASTLDAGIYESYSWSNGQTTASISVVSAGAYSVTVSDASGCTGEDQINVVVNDQLAPEITGQLTICEGEVSVLAVGAFDAYEWSTGAMIPTVEVSESGSYSVTVTDANGCSGTDEIELSVEKASRTEEELQLCYGDTFRGTVFFADAEIEERFAVANGCDSIHIIRLSVASQIGLALRVEDDCIDDGATVKALATDANNDYTYQWSNGAFGAIQSGISEGIISVTVIDGMGCRTVDSVFVDTVQTLGFDYEVKPLSCYGAKDGQIDLTIERGLGPYRVEWSTGDTIEDLSNLGAGLYSVFITDGNNCLVASSVSLFEPDSLVVDIAGTPSTAGNNGTATVNVTGGQTPFSYRWSNGSTDLMLEGLSPGNYTVTVTDHNGCTGVAEITLSTTVSTSEPSSLIALVLYPNPGSGLFWVYLRLNQRKDIQLRVVNVFGQRVLESGPKSGSELELPVDMRYLPAGQYFLTLQLGQERLVKPFIVLR